jgi:hypothetical protein
MKQRRIGKQTLPQQSPKWRGVLSGALIALLLAPWQAMADSPRLALVIGNSRYQQAPLVNPANDARAVAERLRQSGFSVSLKLDAGKHEMSEAIRNFAEQLKTRQAIGVFYYAGHGLQLNWRNFLVPVDARIRQQSDVAAQTVDMGLLLDGLERARNPMNLVILDACRNNPFGPDFRTDDRGLSQLDAPPATLLAFATAPGNTAEDGEGSNGLYTSHLLREMTTPGTRIEDIFKRVRLAVRKQSRGEQIPWESTSLEEDFFLLPANTAKPSETEQQAAFRQELELWLQIRTATTPAPLEGYLRRHPSGKFAELAQFQLDRLLRQQGERPVQPLLPPPSLPGQCSAGSAVIDTAYRVGDRYAFRRLDLLANRENGRFLDQVSGMDQENVYFNNNQKSTDLFGNINRAPDGRRWTPYQFFIADYQLGKRWSAQFVVTNAAGVASTISFDLKVLGRERITTPAGSFDTFRVEARGQNLSQGTTLIRTFWVAPQQVRGFIAQENITKRGEQTLEAERIELVGFAQGNRQQGSLEVTPVAAVAPPDNTGQY